MADQDRCSSGCSRAEPDCPWWSRALSQAWGYLTWPYYVRLMKKAGFRRTGWMTWESGPEPEKKLRAALDERAHAATDGQFATDSLARILGRCAPDEVILHDPSCDCLGDPRG